MDPEQQAAPATAAAESRFEMSNLSFDPINMSPPSTPTRNIPEAQENVAPNYFNDPDAEILFSCRG